MLEDVANLVSEARQHKDLSLEQLADHAHIDASELRELEAGHTHQIFEWPVVKVKRLADALDLNVSLLLGEQLMSYDEWALVWSALIEYSAQRPGLKMKTDMKELILKVRSYIPDHQITEADG